LSVDSAAAAPELDELGEARGIKWRIAEAEVDRISGRAWVAGCGEILRGDEPRILMHLDHRSDEVEHISRGIGDVASTRNHIRGIKWDRLAARHPRDAQQANDSNRARPDSPRFRHTHLIRIVQLNSSQPFVSGRRPG